jgi:hypothetical protein
MSNHPMDPPQGTDVRELVVLLAKLLETAQQLYPGPERAAPWRRSVASRAVSLFSSSALRIAPIRSRADHST